MSDNQSPRIAVKFCGGCNPAYNRRDVLERLKSDFPEAIIRFVSEPPQEATEAGATSGALTDDIALILCGCRNECLDYSRFNGKCGQILVFSEEDYARIFEFMTGWRGKNATR